MNKIEILVKDSVNTRIDKYITLKMKNKSRNFIQNLFNESKIKVNGKNVKSSYRIKNNDFVEIIMPEEKDIKILPEKNDLEIVYEDSFLAIINKPSNMTVHPTEKLLEKTLVNALLYNFSNLSDIDLPFRPGIVHRLDKDTTGLIIIAKDNNTHVALQKILKNREIKKIYLAMVFGAIEEDLIIEKPIGRDLKDRKKMAIRMDYGKEAITKIYPICYNDKYSLIKVDIETGRTHQIRVHLKSIHHEIVGDLTYGRKKRGSYFERQLLHAFSLEFFHPITGEKVKVCCKPDDYFKNAIIKLDLPINDFIKDNILS